MHDFISYRSAFYRGALLYKQFLCNSENWTAAIQQNIFRNDISPFCVCVRASEQELNRTIEAIPGMNFERNVSRVFINFRDICLCKETIMLKCIKSLKLVTSFAIHKKSTDCPEFISNRNLKRKIDWNLNNFNCF